MLPGPEDFADPPARHVPITSSYENLNVRPLNVGGRLSGKAILYVSIETILVKGRVLGQEGKLTTSGLSG